MQALNLDSPISSIPRVLSVNLIQTECREQSITSLSGGHSDIHSAELKRLAERELAHLSDSRFPAATSIAQAINEIRIH